MLALLAAAGLMLASCQQPSAALDSANQLDLTARTPERLANRGEGPVGKPRAQGARYEVFATGSTSPALGEDGGDPPPGLGQQDDGKFTINLDAATVVDASKLILGETLGYNYTIDPNLSGTITMVSNRPLNTSQLLDTFEAALRGAGAALVRGDSGIRIVQAQNALDGDIGKTDMGKDVTLGYGVSAVPLRYVSPASMGELLEGFLTQMGASRISKAGNMILIRGPSGQRKSLVEVIMSFDVDWMKNQTSGFAALENARAEDVASKVKRVFEDDSAMAGPNALKVIPVTSINSLIIIANEPAKVRRAITWIKRLDRESLDAPKSYVYAVQNGNAVELAKILNTTYGGGSGAGPTAEVAPNTQATDVSADAGMGDQSQPPAGQPAGAVPPAPGGQQGGDGMSTSSTDSADGGDGSGGSSGSSGGGGAGSGSIRITPIPTNNTILIRAAPKDYREILATLAQIDAPATQVLISTTIAEVRLNDALQYGVQAYFQSNNISFMLTDKLSSAGSVISPKYPGMNFVIGGIENPQLVVDALSKVTKVRIVSSPSVLVLENETATIKVGDQVPYQTQTETMQGGQTVNSYDYRDTGVVLKVRPRVNANGVVTIDLRQELSAQAQEPGIAGNPKFSQRAIDSKVSVNDHQTVLLGGLINGQESNSRTTVPGADKLPILGKLIGTTGGDASRTEMIVFMTPTIVRNGEGASQASQDLRETMRNLNFN